MAGGQTRWVLLALEKGPMSQIPSARMTRSSARSRCLAYAATLEAVVLAAATALALQALGCRPAPPAAHGSSAEPVAGLAQPTPLAPQATPAALPSAASPAEALPSDDATSLRPFGSAEAFASYAAEVIAKRQKRVRDADSGMAVLGRDRTVSIAQLSRFGAAFPEDVIRGAFPSSGAGDGSDAHRPQAGVHEGDIVKARGDHLIVLRRGRLFSIDLSGSRPRAAGAIDVTESLPPASDGGGRTADRAWHEELLVGGNTALVIGYSCASGGKEIHSFSIDPDGQFQRLGTAVVRAQDYFASRKYVSRLNNHTLEMYVPIPLLQGWGGDEQTQLPAQRRAGKGQPSSEGAWTDLIARDRLFRPIQATSSPVVHTVLRCDIRNPQITCTANAVLGPSAQTFYVSSRAVYVWVAGGAEEQAVLGTARPEVAAGVCYQIPFDGRSPTAVRVWGAPIDQQSFSEQPDGTLQVLVWRHGNAAGIWRTDWPQSSTLALATLPASAFTAVGSAAQPEFYRLLPAPGNTSLGNRFVGRWLLYGSSQDRFGDRRGHKPPLYLVDRATGQIAQVPLSHSADRIDPLGMGVVVTGTRAADLALTTVALSGTAPVVVGEFTRKGAARSELRTQGLVYQPTSPAGGVLGLALVAGEDEGLSFGGRGVSTRSPKGRSSAEVLFLEVADLRLRSLGALTSQGGALRADDHCQTSCTDWHGNARSIFWRGRILALLGYELIEGELTGGRLRPAARLNFWEDHPLRKQLATPPPCFYGPCAAGKAQP